MIKLNDIKLDLPISNILTNYIVSPQKPRNQSASPSKLKIQSHQIPRVDEMVILSTGNGKICNFTFIVKDHDSDEYLMFDVDLDRVPLSVFDEIQLQTKETKMFSMRYIIA